MIDINAKQVREVFGFLIAVPTCDFLLAVTFYPQHRCWAVSGTGPDRTGPNYSVVLDRSGPF